MYSLPQEIEVWYIIPAIRRELAKSFIKKYKIKQNKVAELLGTTEAAISQYMHRKRAKDIKFSEEMVKYVEQSAEIILKDNKKVIGEMMKLIEVAKRQGVSCDICKKYNKGVLHLCSAKPEQEIAR
ncbi:MAG: hypothetical protein NTX24_03750 [Candidatus Pacearchaeota archaeon]|nr:hypothetical protein [Candidatus Pacearchaeota archaeon]